jgi:uncharacterized repeat protein (TIGR01451 family)
MRPLSEVFAPGAPTLPERLRTLVVSPERELEPGMTVRATFTFRNQGGAPATGVRLRFNVPDGLVYLVGSGRLDGQELDDEFGNSPLLARAGAHVGDVSPGEERQIEIAYSVAGAIENGSVVELQAALASFELPPAGSNIVRLVVRSKPQLRNALTRITIEAHDPAPGAEAQVTVRVHNAGESSARDVVVVSPIPEHTAYVAGSAQINGRHIEHELGSPFDRTYAPVVVRSLPANGSATLVYRVRIDAPLDDGSQIVARAQVGSQETPAFVLEPASLTVVAAPDFGGEHTTFAGEPTHDVRPGERVSFSLSAENVGTADAQRVAASIELPESLLWVRGASTIDGRAARERRKEPLRFALGRVGVGDRAILRIEAIVLSPLPDATVLTTVVTLEWESASPQMQRRFECSITVRSEPAFPARRNYLTRRGNEIVRPGEAIEATIALSNDGSAAAHDGVLHVRVIPALEEIAVFEGSTRLSLDRSSASSPYADTLDLGTIEPSATRRLSIRARIPSPCADRSELRVGTSLHTRELGETPLREAFWRVDSHPAFSAETSLLELSEDSVLRPNQLAQIDVALTNVGTETAHNACLRLYVSPEARLESVDGATRERSSLLFGEIPPGGTARARLGLRLLRSLAKEYPVTIDGFITADAVLPVPLTRLVIATTAEPDFSIGSFRSDPSGSVDVGEAIDWTLQIRNGGDGVAHHVRVAIETPDALIYVPNSTTVSEVPLRDVGALPPFSPPGGIALNEVDPGVEATVRWRTVVHSGLPAGSVIAYVARIGYDGDRVDEIASAELNVHASPVFADAIPGLPFGLDGMVGPGLAGSPRALTEERFMQLPPATPVGEGNGALYIAQLAAGTGGEEAELSQSVGTLAAFTPERLGRALRFLREARFGTLVTHLFAVRAFLPDAIGDAHCSGLVPLRDLLHDELDRLFIKLRLPNYAIAARDIETPSLRSVVERLLHEARNARGLPSESPTAAIELRGTFISKILGDFADRLPSSELAGALPWAALACLLPDDSPLYADYRERLTETLEALADSDANDFIDALAHRHDADLDAALDAMCVSLHAIA